jgi:hypothetical protein
VTVSDPGSSVPRKWGVSPKQSIERECALRGRPAVVAGCIDLLEGRPVDDALVIALAGPAALPVLRGAAGGRTGSWPRVWGARGLLHAWDDSATGAIVRGGSDEAWRVREKVAQIVAAHRVDDALEVVVRLRADPVPRVRVAAERAVMRLTERSS